MINGYSFYYWNIAALSLSRLTIKDRKKFLLIACFQFFLVLALRSNRVGHDSFYHYPNMYAGASDMSFTYILQNWSFINMMPLPNGYQCESGYATLNWIFGGLLGLNYHVFIAFLALIAAVSVYKYLERNSCSPLLGAAAVFVYLLYVNSYFSAIRRSTALTFIHFALIAMDDRKYVKSALILILAATMHRSALIMFAVMPLVNIKLTRDLFRKFILVLAVTMIFAAPIAMKFLPDILELFGKSSYLYGRSGWLNTNRLLESKVIASIIAVVAIYFCLDFRLLNNETNNIPCRVFLFLVAFLPIQQVIPILHDIYSYFMPSCYFFVGNIIVQRREDSFIKRVMWLIVFMILIYVMSKQIYNPDMYYRTFWNSRYGD